VITKFERGHGYTQPGYAELWRHKDSEGQIFFPDSKDWQECVAIAEALP
jgi:hypothetical protein